MFEEQSPSSLDIPANLRIQGAKYHSNKPNTFSE